MSRSAKFATAGVLEDGEISVRAQHHFAPADQWDRDLYARERVLNAAILAADISRGWEEYLEILDAFYADDVEVTAETEPDPARGKERIRELLFNFLAPLHVMVESGGLAVHARESSIRGDAPDETHSTWSVSLIGVNGRTCTLDWCTLRRWEGSRVIYEHHYDYQQDGGPLTEDDLDSNLPPGSAGDHQQMEAKGQRSV
jgi:hypothetical protein